MIFTSIKNKISSAWQSIKTVFSGIFTKQQPIVEIKRETYSEVIAKKEAETRAAVPTQIINTWEQEVYNPNNRQIERHQFHETYQISNDLMPQAEKIFTERLSKVDNYIKYKEATASINKDLDAALSKYHADKEAAEVKKPVKKSFVNDLSHKNRVHQSQPISVC